ncbi:MAG: Rab family GTPase [Cyclobacteriaceae bacterium]
MEISKKVVVAGHFGVGKTSLIKRFVHQKFSDQYLTTIGVKIDKKTVDINGTSVNMILWDIAGEQSTSKIPKNYFMGAHGLLYVFDLSREETYKNLSDQLFEITKDNPNIQTTVLGNKSDLVNESLIEEIRSETSLNFKITSAMTGENVETAFKDLAENLI